MKKILFNLALCALALGFSSCNDDNDELTDSFVTHYAEINLVGGDFIELPIGTPYIELGYSASEEGEDVTDAISVSGSVDSQNPGLYELEYSFTNKDGFASSVTRTVAVCDQSITTDISGSYILQRGSYRNYNGDIVPFDGYTVRVTKAAPGIFYVNDMLASWYRKKAGGGSSYAMTGYIMLDADNNITLISSYVRAWGDSADYLEGYAIDHTERLKAAIEDMVENIKSAKQDWAIDYSKAFEKDDDDNFVYSLMEQYLKLEGIVKGLGLPCEYFEDGELETNGDLAWEVGYAGIMDFFISLKQL